jgi:hypothetical protein
MEVKAAILITRLQVAGRIFEFHVASNYALLLFELEF